MGGLNFILVVKKTEENSFAVCKTTVNIFLSELSANTVCSEKSFFSAYPWAAVGYSTVLKSYGVRNCGTQLCLWKKSLEVVFCLWGV